MYLVCLLSEMYSQITIRKQKLIRTNNKNKYIMQNTHF